METKDGSDKTNAPNGPKKDIRSQLGGFDQNFQWERKKLWNRIGQYFRILRRKHLHKNHNYYLLELERA